MYFYTFCHDFPRFRHKSILFALENSIVAPFICYFSIFLFILYVICPGWHDCLLPNFLFFCPYELKNAPFAATWTHLQWRTRGHMVFQACPHPSERVRGDHFIAASVMVLMALLHSWTLTFECDLLTSKTPVPNFNCFNCSCTHLPSYSPWPRRFSHPKDH